MFSEVSPTYERVNHAMTLGLDIRWRRMTAKEAAAGSGNRWIDVCSGTGDLAACLSHLAGEHTTILAADFCMDMLGKATLRPEADQIAFVLADANSTPFPDATFDLVTTSFATRNLNVSRDKLTQCFREFNRILRAGGRFVSVETSQPSSKLVRKLFHLYVKLTVIPLGYAISGTRDGYSYLSNTIRRFYDAAELADILREAGFASVSYRHLMLGAAAIHKAVK